MKTAFVLSGGGVKGSFQAGVIYQLIKKGIKPDALYGTSVGALNACAYAFLGEDRMLEHWLSIKGRSEALSPNGWQWIYAWPKLFYKDGIYSTKPLRKYITEIVMNNEPTTFAISCYVDLKSGNTAYVSSDWPKEEYIESVIASSTIPVIMETCNHKVDGGVREQTPLSQAILDGYDDIYIILCKPYGADNTDGYKPSKLFPMFEVLRRSTDDLMCQEIFLTDLDKWITLKKLSGLRQNLHLYMPDRVWMSTIEFDPIKIKNAVEAGLVAQEISINDYKSAR